MSYFLHPPKARAEGGSWGRGAGSDTGEKSEVRGRKREEKGRKKEERLTESEGKGERSREGKKEMEEEVRGEERGRGREGGRRRWGRDSPAKGSDRLHLEFRSKPLSFLKIAQPFPQRGWQQGRERGTLALLW